MRGSGARGWAGPPWAGPPSGGLGRSPGKKRVGEFFLHRCCFSLSLSLLPLPSLLTPRARQVDRNRQAQQSGHAQGAGRGGLLYERKREWREAKTNGRESKPHTRHLSLSHCTWSAAARRAQNRRTRRESRVERVMALQKENRERRERTARERSRPSFVGQNVSLFKRVSLLRTRARAAPPLARSRFPYTRRERTHIHPKPLLRHPPLPHCALLLTGASPPLFSARPIGASLSRVSLAAPHTRYIPIHLQPCPG